MRFNTRAVHAGQSADPATGALCTPIYQTSTFVQDDIGVHKGFDYSRAGNPTREALEKNLAALEDAEYGFAFSSGMAAVQALTVLMKRGDHLVSTAGVYGGTFRFFMEIMSPYGLEFSFVDTSDPALVEAALRPETRMLFIETPTNPMMVLTDIAAMAEIARARELILVVDNTFLSPYFQAPLALGADISLHSCTKYIGGHSDLISGALMTNVPEYAERFAYVQKCTGAIPGPFECFLLLRSTKTLGLRMERHYENAIRIAHMLTDHPKVKTVYYPGLGDHPQHELGMRQMKSFGGMLSFELESFEAARRVTQNLRLIVLAESLGGVESLINHPVLMTHASVPERERKAYGLHDTLLRLSVGIEDHRDLEADLAQALDKA